MMRVPLLRRDGSICAYACVDDLDHDDLMQFRWYKHSRGYAARSQDGTTVLMHRQIMGFPSAGVDHRNRDKLDNRRANLRVATQLQNSQNVRTRTGGLSRFRGVTLDRKTGRWVAQVKVDGRLYRSRKHGLGSFHTEQEAALAAQAFRRRHMPYSGEE